MKLTHLFTSVHMGLAHDGLSKIAKSKGISLDKLPEGTGCLFLSRDRMRMKSYSWNGVLSYMKARQNRPFTLDAVQEFATAWSRNGSFDYDTALRKHLEKVFSIKYNKVEVKHYKGN